MIVHLAIDLVVVCRIVTGFFGALLVALGFGLVSDHPASGARHVGAFVAIAIGILLFLCAVKA